MTAGLDDQASKVTGNDTETTDALDTERTVIVKAQLHNPGDFKGEFDFNP